MLRTVFPLLFSVFYSSNTLGLVLTGLLLQWLGAVPTRLIEWLILLLGAIAITCQRQFWRV